MALSPEQMDRMMDEHFAFEGRDDVEGVLATLSEDVEHDIVGWPFGPAHNRDGARQFYEMMFGGLADSSVRCGKRLYGANFMVDESVWSGKAPGMPFGLEGRNRPLEFRLLHVVEFAERKRKAKGADWIVANDVSPETNVMGGDRNTVHLVTARGVESWPEMSKDEVADRLMLHAACLELHSPETGLYERFVSDVPF